MNSKVEEIKKLNIKISELDKLLQVEQAKTKELLASKGIIEE